MKQSFWDWQATKPGHPWPPQNWWFRNFDWAQLSSIGVSGRRHRCPGSTTSPCYHLHQCKPCWFPSSRWSSLGNVPEWPQHQDLRSMKSNPVLMPPCLSQKKPVTLVTKRSGTQILSDLGPSSGPRAWLDGPCKRTAPDLVQNPHPWHPGRLNHPGIQRSWSWSQAKLSQAKPS